MKILISIETEKALETVPRIVDYVDGFKINHIMLKQVSKYAYPELFKEQCTFSNKMMHLYKDNKSLDNNQW